MKKLFICASVFGLAAGVVYWIFKKNKSTTTAFKTVDKKVNFETNTQVEENFQDTGTVEEMYKAKSDSAQSVYERHSEAAFIMKDAYSNIMKDFSDKKDKNAKAENKDIVIDSEFISVMKEIDSISDELDDLLN